MENLTDLLFSALLNIQDDVQDGSNNMVGNHMVFAMIHCTEKRTDSYFSYLVLFLSLFWYPSIHASSSRPLLAGSDKTIMS